jgi:glycyl-tRNA synthetase beta chain
MYRELLIEIGCEELPASWLPPLVQQLGACVGARLEAARLACPTPPESFATPRRLAVRAARVAERQPDIEETLTGPPLRAALTAGGEDPTPAALGFARKHGVAVNRLIRIETPKGTYLAHRRRQRGKAARTVLGGVLAATLRDLAFPKQMHWDARLDDGRGDLLFGRPIRWLVFLFGGRVVPFVIGRTPEAEARGVAPIRAGSTTRGHRFFAREGRPGRPVRVGSFAEYRKTLKRHYVLLSREDRRARIAKKLESNAKRVGGIVGGAGGATSLLDEVPDLVEYPSVVTGRFPEEFLALPDEVLKTTMIHHQHYFPVATSDGRLTEHFLAVTNVPQDNVPAIARNSERVLVARLRDARFFWGADRRAPLASRLDRLDTLRFHAKLGSYLAKARRIEGLAGVLAGEAFGAPAQVDHAARAARLAKADLTTDMVGEFPELQGVMGGIYAREDGEPEEVWRAIYHHYLPIGVTADAPPRPGDLGRAGISWAATALADKLDTLVGLFQAGEQPRGARDPFGLRRQAHGVFGILVDLPELTGLTARPDLGRLVAAGEAAHEAAHGGGHESATAPEVTERLQQFLLERLRFVLEQRGHDVRNVRAVTQPWPSWRAVTPLDARRKLEALPGFTGSTEFQQLAALFKRVRNIARELSDAELGDVEAGRAAVSDDAPEPAEAALAAELERRRPAIAAAVAAGTDYHAAFAEAAAFGPAVDRFFTDVLVMAGDPDLRRRRLALLKRLERLILQLADVSALVKEAD